MNPQPIHSKSIIFTAHKLMILFLQTLLLMSCSSPSASISLPIGLSDAITGNVDVGGNELYYICVGEGSPTVILEAGGGGDSSGWELVMLYYQGYTRVCAYDRANLGKSDSASKPRTFTDMTRDLHTLLQKASIEGPYILAGHSMGGMLVRLYASQYPEDVVGLVLVDSAHPDMGDRLLATLPPETAGEDKGFKAWRQYATWMSSSAGEALVDAEGVDMRVSNEQVRAVKSLGDLPLAVVSRSPKNPVMVGGFPSLPDEINTNLMQKWQDMQTELEGLSSNSIRFTAVRSGHGVPLEEPRLVVDAIRHVVDEYRLNAGILVPPALLKTDAVNHAPVLKGITERKKWVNGMLVIYEDISFTDAAGDAITVINKLVSAPPAAAISDDIIRAPAAEQKQGTVLTSYIRCRDELTVVIEYQVFDAAGNTSAPETVTFSCPAPRPYLNPFLIGGIILALVFVVLGIWLLGRRRRFNVHSVTLSLLLALLLTACATPQTQPMHASTPQSASQNHAPVILQVAGRTGTRNGRLLIYKDIYFTDPDGDAVSAIYTVVSSSLSYSLNLPNVPVEAPAEEQRSKALFPEVTACWQKMELAYEIRIQDKAGNLSEPVLITLSCAVPPPLNTSPYLVSGFSTALPIAIILLLGFWLLFRKNPSERLPALRSMILMVFLLMFVRFLHLVFHEGGHSLYNLVNGIPNTLYIHPFFFRGFSRPIIIGAGIWKDILGSAIALPVGVLIFILFWKLRSLSLLPLVMLAPYIALGDGYNVMGIQDDFHNLVQSTGLPATPFFILGTLIFCFGLISFLSLLPLAGLDPRDHKALFALPAALFLICILSFVVACLVVPGSPINREYFMAQEILSDNFFVFWVGFGIVLAVLFVTLFRKFYPRLPAWLRAETVNLTWKDLRIPALLAAISIIVGLIIIT